jgi:hypothetical protein
VSVGHEARVLLLIGIVTLALIEVGDGSRSFV